MYRILSGVCFGALAGALFPSVPFWKMVVGLGVLSLGLTFLEAAILAEVRKRWVSE